MNGIEPIARITQVISHFFRYQWTLALLILTVLGVGMLGIVVDNQGRMKHSIEEASQKQLAILHHSIHTQLTEFERTMEEGSHLLTPDLSSENTEHLQTNSQHLLNIHPAFDSLITLNLNGKITSQVNKEKESNLNIQQELNSSIKWPTQFDVSIYNKATQPFFVLKQPLHTSTGELLGLMVASIRGDYLSRNMAFFHLSEGTKSALALKNGHILSLEPKPKDAFNASLKNLNDWGKPPPSYPKQPVKLDSGTFANHYTASTAVLPNNIHGGSLWPIEIVIWIDPSPFERIWIRDSSILLGCFSMFCIIATWGIRQSNKQHRQQAEIRETARVLEHYQQERFLLATETADIGVWEYLPPEGLFEWNQSMRRMYGAEHLAARIPYAQWLSMVDEQDRLRVDTLIQQARTQDTVFEFQFNIRRKNDGLVRNIHAHAKQHRNNEAGQLRIIGIHIDVTTEQQSELALQEAEERFRSAFQSSAIGMAILNPSGMFTQVNAALCNWVGYNEAELLQMDYVSITHPEDAMLHWPTATEIGSDIRDDYQVEQRYIHKDGHVLWGLMAVSAVRDKTQKILHLIMQVQDITARKRHETTLIEREHFLRTLSECLPGLVSYWSTDQLCYFANKNHEKLNSLPIEKIRGQHLRKVLGEETYEQHRHHIEGVLDGKQQRFEKIDTLPTGKTVDMLVHLIPDILYGKVEGFFSISTNITDFKAQQRELQLINKELIERTEQAETANKAKGAFLANMSHEIRTPMNAIMGLLQLIEETPLTPTQHDYIRKTGGAAEVLLNVLNDILDISRVEANKLELSISRFNLDQLLNNSIDLFSYRADEKKIRIFYTKEENCPHSLLGDRLRLAQILNNLLSNAIKFTERGYINLQIQMTSGKDQLEFRVQDTGIGMTEAQCQLLFEPFSQVDESPSRRYGGAGLGLSICKQLTELMQGKIWVKSRLEHGTTFHFTIPCLEPNYTLDQTKSVEKIQEAESEKKQANHTVLQGLRILVVDDHKLNRIVASEMLRKWGADVVLASNGVQAVEACLNSHFNWVLMDLQMPEMDGFEATRIIRSKLGNKAPPIIALTASASDTDRANLLQAGMCDQIIKPFKKSDLENRLIHSA